MKVYKFEIIVKHETSSSNLIDSFIKEVQDEERQASLTYEINKKTTQLHKEILTDFVNAINKELTRVGLEFNKDFTESVSSNNYSGFITSLNKDADYVIKIHGRSDDKFKYMTYTGDFKICISKYGRHGRVTDVESVDEVIKYMKDVIKNQIKNIKK